MGAIDQRVLAGGFLFVSTVVFGIAVWPHLREPPETVDVEAVFARESTFNQLIAANIALGLCAATISMTADAINAYQRGADPFAEAR